LRNRNHIAEPRERERVVFDHLEREKKGALAGVLRQDAPAKKQP